MPTGDAIIDRFLHHAETIEITGRNYRLKDKAHQRPKDPCKDDEESV